MVIRRPGELDNLDRPSSWCTVAIGHDSILPQLRGHAVRFSGRGKEIPVTRHGPAYERTPAGRCTLGCGSSRCTADLSASDHRVRLKSR